MLITIHQPDFLPWLGFFHRWAQSDLLILLDDVQFLRQGWHHRDKIKSPAGETWLTVPIKKKGRLHQEIRETQIDNSTNWRETHLRTIQHCYAHARSFGSLFPLLKRVYEKEQQLLMELNLDLLQLFAERLAISTPCRFSSEFGMAAKSTEKLIALVQAAGGRAYLSGLGARTYLNERLFEENGLGLEYQQFTHPEYTQLHGPFVSMLSSLDYLMNVDEAAARTLFHQFSG